MVMPAMVVLDASVVVGALLDSGDTGLWSRRQLSTTHLHAPHLLPAEVTSVLRRVVFSDAAQRSTVQQALLELGDLDIAMHDFLPLAPRVWELRHNLSAYDAWYVALAEALDAPLVTLDRRLSRAPGLGCEVLVPVPG